MTKIQIFVILAGIASDLDISSKMSTLAVLIYTFCHPEEMWPYVLLVGSSLTSSILKSGSYLTYNDGIQMIIEIVLTAVLTFQIKKFLRENFMEEACQCKAP